MQQVFFTTLPFSKKILGLCNFRSAILRQPGQDCVVVLGHPPNVRLCTLQNILLIFWLFLVFPHKKMSAIGFRRGWKTNLNHHFSVSSCCSELTFMFCYESLKAVALTWVAGNFIIVFSIFILGRVDVKPQVGADWSLCWNRSQLLSRSDQCWVFVGISWVFVGISWVFVG